MISISVVMPVYNTPVSILSDAVRSILSQTFRDFEFIIIDDGSTNDSIVYLQSLRDERIRLIRNPKNIGVTKSLNVGLQTAKGKYIARMDSDDIALPIRFQRQFSFMEDHPEVIVCGSNIEYFGARAGRSYNRIEDMDLYRIQMLFFNPGQYHPTVFFNQELLQRNNLLYDDRLRYYQDYGLWTEVSRHGEVYILEDALLRYRVHSAQISTAHRDVQLQCAGMIQEKLLRELLGNVSGDDMRIHRLCSQGLNGSAVANDKVLRWCERLLEANNRIGIYDKKKFDAYIYDEIVKRVNADSR